jgi:TonB family protein
MFSRLGVFLRRAFEHRTGSSAPGFGVWPALLFSISVHAAFLGVIRELDVPTREAEPTTPIIDTIDLTLALFDAEREPPAGLAPVAGLEPVRLNPPVNLPELPQFDLPANVSARTPPEIAPPVAFNPGGAASADGSPEGTSGSSDGGAGPGSSEPTTAHVELLRYVPGNVGAWLKNHERIQRELERRYPQHMRLSGLEGRVELQLWINEQGTVLRYAVKSASNNAFRRVAEQVIPLLEIAPPINRGTPVSAVLDLPIVFRIRY